MLIYMAHPVRPLEGETLEQNIHEAKQWLKWLHKHMPAWHTIAPWLVEVELYGDSDEAQREASLERACAAVRQCHGLVLAGRRVSQGMRREAREAMLSGLPVYDLTWMYRWSMDVPLRCPPDDRRPRPYPLQDEVQPGFWPSLLKEPQ